MRTTENSRIIHATKEKIYHAFLDERALEFWQAPENITGKMHGFDGRVGGGYTMSLFYVNKLSVGKTSGNEDRFFAKFVELSPHDRIVLRILFDSDKEEFGEELTMEVALVSTGDNATKVTIIFRNLPVGIDQQANETGTDQSLQKLARYVENNQTTDA